MKVACFLSAWAATATGLQTARPAPRGLAPIAAKKQRKGFATETRREKKRETALDDDDDLDRDPTLVAADSAGKAKKNKEAEIFAKYGERRSAAAVPSHQVDCV